MAPKAMKSSDNHANRAQTERKWVAFSTSVSATQTLPAFVGAPDPFRLTELKLSRDYRSACHNVHCGSPIRRTRSSYLGSPRRDCHSAQCLRHSKNGSRWTKPFSSHLNVSFLSPRSR